MAVHSAMVLHRRGHFAVDVGLITRVPRMVIASALMGVVLLVSQGQMESLLAGVLLERILGLAGLVVVGLVVYGILALVMRIATVDDLRRVLNRRPASA